MKTLDFKTARRKGIAQQLRLLADQIDAGEVLSVVVGAMMQGDEDNSPVPVTYAHGSAPMIAGTHTFIGRRVHRIMDDLEN